MLHGSYTSTIAGIFIKSFSIFIFVAASSGYTSVSTCMNSWIDLFLSNITKKVYLEPTTI